jgi:hypothetical protein
VKFCSIATKTVLRLRNSSDLHAGEHIAYLFSHSDSIFANGSSGDTRRHVQTSNEHSGLGTALSSP